jgi:altronate hydrolase
METGKMGLNDIVAEPGVVPLEEVAVRLHPRDDVAISAKDLAAGTTLFIGAGWDEPGTVVLCRAVPSGHKIALRQMKAGVPIRRYGQVIGFASQAIAPGEHVHTHNLGIQALAHDYAVGEGAVGGGAVGGSAQPVAAVPEAERRTFRGYRRRGGRVGTRNYIALLSSVNCSAHTAREIAHHFTVERLAAFPNVDGVIALVHQSGCANEHLLLQRTLAGMARHPNVGAALLVGLGCETDAPDRVVENHGLCDGCRGLPGIQRILIQELGGIRKTVQAGIAWVEDVLPPVNDVRREPVPISELVLALQCGGSDSWSGVTANPVVGLVADRVVEQGGSVVLSETPEIYGAEHLLARRAPDPSVGQRLLEEVRWWEAYTERMGLQMDDNRALGNEAGGLTTIYEKSLGAVAKAGSSPLVDVLDYAEPVQARGLTFMNAPGFDPVAVTGQVAGGCNLVIFSTGRGSVFGFKPAPSIKISSNSATYQRLTGDMDLNAGRVLEGESLERVAADLLDLVIAVASGGPSKSEAQGVGEAEFAPWNREGTL